MKRFLFVLAMCASGLLYGAQNATQTVTQTTTTQTQVTNQAPGFWDKFKQGFGMGAFCTAVSACSLAYGGAWSIGSVAPCELWIPSTIFSSIAVPIVGGIVLGKPTEKAYAAGLFTSGLTGVVLAYGLPKLQTLITGR